MAISPAGTREQLLRQLGGDEEDSPWMVSTDLHRRLVMGLLQALERYLKTQSCPWYVSGKVFVQYGPAAGDHVAPDVFVAPVANHLRDSYIVAEEGLFPPLVMEVVTAFSWTRDTAEKVTMYDLLGAREYVLYDPTRQGAPHSAAGAAPPAVLWGYRRDAQGQWDAWPAGADGSLRSEVLGGVQLRLEDNGLRVLTPEGTPVPSTAELDNAYRMVEQQRLQKVIGIVSPPIFPESTTRLSETHVVVLDNGFATKQEGRRRDSPAAFLFDLYRAMISQ